MNHQSRKWVNRYDRVFEITSTTFTDIETNEVTAITGGVSPWIILREDMYYYHNLMGFMIYPKPTGSARVELSYDTVAEVEALTTTEIAWPNGDVSNFTADAIDTVFTAYRFVLASGTCRCIVRGTFY